MLPKEIISILKVDTALELKYLNQRMDKKYGPSKHAGITNLIYDKLRRYYYPKYMCTKLRGSKFHKSYIILKMKTQIIINPLMAGDFFCFSSTGILC